MKEKTEENKEKIGIGAWIALIVLILVLALVVLMMVGSDKLAAGFTFLVSPESRGG